MADIIEKVEEFLREMTSEEIEALLEKHGNSNAPRGPMYMSRTEYLLSKKYNEQNEQEMIHTIMEK